MRNKIFTKIIITTLLVTFLTFNVGRVTRVSAVGTTAAIAATAFVLTGAVYMSYVALTQGEMLLPAADELHDWLSGVGRKVSQYPSGSAAYQEIYQNIAREPFQGVIDDVWTWTQDKLRSFANDFSNTNLINNILEYYQNVDMNITPTNGFDYSAFNFVDVPLVLANGQPFTSVLPSDAIPLPIGAKFIRSGNNGYVFSPTDIYDPVRNVLLSDGTYRAQYYHNGIWQDIYNQHFGYIFQSGSSYTSFVNNYSLRYYDYTDGLYSLSLGSNATTYPIFPQERIYDSVNDEYLPVVVPEGYYVGPSWTDPDNENRPIIPWVPIPDFPTGVPVPPGYTGPPQWGFPLQELLDLLEELARNLINIGAIGELINRFAGQHGDNYYLEYNDGDTNYYTYYQPTIFDNDTEYVTYNINVSEQDDNIPVDLNTISIYSDNRYLDQIKKSAIAGSSMLRDLAVFWHDVDPEITYIVLGCCILVLIGAFTGKLGHS